MAQTLDTEMTSSDGRPTWDDRLARPMFILAMAFLVVLAGLIHRLPRLEPDDPEAFLILGGLAVLWLVFLIEAAIRIPVHLMNGSGWKPLTGTLACALIPPFRMGGWNQARPDEIWLPRLG